MKKYCFIVLLSGMSLFAEPASMSLGVTHYADKIVTDLLQPTLHIQTESCESDIEALKLLEEKKLDFAVVTNRSAYQAYKKNMPNLRAVAALYPKMLALVTQKEFNLDAKVLEKELAQLRYVGKNAYVTVQDLFDLNRSEDILDFNRSKELLLAGKIKGFFTLEGHPNARTDKLLKEQNLSLVPLVGKRFDQLKNDFSYYLKGGIPKGIYGLDRDIKSIGLRTVIVTREDVNETRVYQLVKGILEHQEAFKKANPVYRGISKKHLLQKLALPQHKGAVKAFNDF